MKWGAIVREGADERVTATRERASPRCAAGICSRVRREALRAAATPEAVTTFPAPAGARSDASPKGATSDATAALNLRQLLHRTPAEAVSLETEGAYREAEARDPPSLRGRQRQGAPAAAQASGVRTASVL